MKTIIIFLSLLAATETYGACLSQEQFKHYAVKDNYVLSTKDISFQMGGSSVWVKLKDQYSMTKPEIKNVATLFGYEYKKRTCSKESLIIISVWDYRTEKIIMKVHIKQ